MRPTSADACRRRILLAAGTPQQIMDDPASFGGADALEGVEDLVVFGTAAGEDRDDVFDPAAQVGWLGKSRSLTAIPGCLPISRSTRSPTPAAKL